MDLKISGANTKFTRRLRSPPRLEQRSDHRPEATIETKTRLGIRMRLELTQNYRDLALFNMTIGSKLRGRDLVKIKVVDVIVTSLMKDRASVHQSKT